MFIRFIDGIQAPYTYAPRKTSSTVTPVGTLSGSAPVSHDTEGNATPNTELPHSRNPYAQHSLQEPDPRTPALRVEQIMSPKVESLPPAALLRDAHTLFRSRRYRHVPVIDSDGRLRGIISDRDILAQQAADGGPFSWSLPLEQVMKRHVLTSRRETDIRMAARVLFEERIGCLPVCEDSGRVVGILTRSDILRAIIQNAPLQLWI